MMVISLTSCVTYEGDGDESAEKQEEAKDFATKENPADPTEKQTISGMWGTFSFKLDKAYCGDDAITKLKEMGENTEDNFSDSRDGFKFVLLEYTVSADDGFDDNDFMFADVIGDDMWDTELKSKYEYAVYDLYENASLDYYNLTLNTGEESKMYEIMELPDKVDSYITSISGEDREYWFLYNLK